MRVTAAWRAVTTCLDGHARCSFSRLLRLGRDVVGESGQASLLFLGVLAAVLAGVLILFVLGGRTAALGRR
jgi:hypothetical protein